MNIPKKYIVTQDIVAFSDIGKEMKKVGINFGSDKLLLGKISYMSMFLMDEMAKGSDSYFHKYLSYFPQDLSSYPA